MLKVYFRKKNLYFLLLVALIFLITNSFFLTEARSALILTITNGLFATLLCQLIMKLWSRTLADRHKNCEITEVDYLD